MECLNGCEFQKLDKGKFHCDYYLTDLIFEVSDMLSDIKIMRCGSCEKEGLIGKNSIQERVIKVKHRVGLVMDSFYSFKDDLESEITDIYRILKDLENEDK